MIIFIAYIIISLPCFFVYRFFVRKRPVGEENAKAFIFLYGFVTTIANLAYIGNSLKSNSVFLYGLSNLHTQAIASRVGAGVIIANFAACWMIYTILSDVRKNHMSKGSVLLPEEPNEKHR